MAIEDERSQTFVEKVLVPLEERFPWLGSEHDEAVGGADTVDELTDLSNLCFSIAIGHVAETMVGKAEQRRPNPGRGTCQSPP
jgi:hypothetical protein